MNTNLRSVKTEERGATILTAPQKAAKRLCESCCSQLDCKHKVALERLELAHSIPVIIKHCPHFVYPIVFRDSKGLIAGCNTMRMGKAWSNRVERGDAVGFVDKDNKVFSTATVKEVLLLSKAEALAEHSHLNHMLIEDSLGKQEAAGKLAKILRNNYGNLVYKNNDLITVIYFNEPSG